MFLKQTNKKKLKLYFTFLPSKREIKSNLKCFAYKMCIYSSLNCFNNYTTINCQSNYAFYVSFWRESVNLVCSLYHLNCLHYSSGLDDKSMGFIKGQSLVKFSLVQLYNSNCLPWSSGLVDKERARSRQFFEFFMRLL